MKLLTQFFLGFLSLCTSFAQAASLPEWTIVPAQSELKFTANQNGAPVSGIFKTFTGEILVDPANYQQSSIHISVDMNSISASYADLVSTLSSPDWFNVKMFPKAEFKAIKFDKIDAKTYLANGTLTIRDKSVPVVLKFTAVEDPKDHATVEGDTVIKRSDFGVGQGDWASTDEIKDEVAVHFKVVADKKK